MIIHFTLNLSRIIQQLKVDENAWYQLKYGKISADNLVLFETHCLAYY